MKQNCRIEDYDFVEVLKFSVNITHPMDCSILPLVSTMSDATIYLLVAVNIITSILTVVVNYFFIRGIISKPLLLTPTNLLVMSLACSDLLVGLVTQPMMCAFLLVNITRPRYCVTAQITFFSLGVFCGASGLCLPVISLDRYIRMKKLTYYMKYVTKQRAMAAIVVTWVNAIVLSFSPLYGLKQDLFYLLLLVYLAFLLAVMTLAYVSVTKRSSVQVSRVNPPTNQGISLPLTSPTGPVSVRLSPRPNVEYSRQMRITMIVALLVVMVIVSWLPAFIVCFIWALDKRSMDKNRTIVTLHYATITFGCACSAVNPLLYCSRIREVRKAAMDVFWNTIKCSS